MDLIVIIIREKNGQIRTHIHALGFEGGKKKRKRGGKEKGKQEKVKRGETGLRGGKWD